MSRRKPTRPPARRPSTSRYKSQSQSSFPWVWVLGIMTTLVMFAAAGLFLRSQRSSSSPSSSVTNAPSTVQHVTTSVATTALGSTPSSNTAVSPTTSPALPKIETAVTINIQRDEDVDPTTGIATWTEPASHSEISVRVRLADGTPMNEYVRIHKQTADVSGNPAYGDEIATGYTRDAGIFTEGVPADTYIVKFQTKGWSWDDQFSNHLVANGQRTNILFDVSLFTVGIRYADGEPVNEYVHIHLQEDNVSGQPVEGNEAASGYTDDDGLVTFMLTPGVYAVRISHLHGYDTWGRFDHQLPGGGIYNLTVTLGRLIVETWNPDGSLATNIYTKIHTLDQDASGNIILGKQIASAYSDNTGKAIFDLTPGLYGISYDNTEFVSIPVQPSQITTIHQTGYTIP